MEQRIAHRESHLSGQQVEVLCLVVAGKSNRQIAEEYADLAYHCAEAELSKPSICSGPSTTSEVTRSTPRSSISERYLLLVWAELALVQQKPVSARRATASQYDSLTSREREVAAF